MSEKFESGFCRLVRLSEVTAELAHAPAAFYRLWIVQQQAASDVLELGSGQLNHSFYFCPPALTPRIDYNLLDGFVCWFNQSFVLANPHLRGFAELLTNWTNPLPTVRTDETMYRSCISVWHNHSALPTNEAGTAARIYTEVAYLHQTLIISYWHLLLRRTTGWLVPPQRMRPLTQQFLELLDDEPLRFGSPATYARKLHVSESTLLKKVKADLEVSPAVIIQARRIKSAQQQLLTTRSPIGEISDSLGYGSHAYFSEQFKQHTQMSPQAYRKLHTAVIDGLGNQ